MMSTIHFVLTYLCYVIPFAILHVVPLAFSTNPTLAHLIPNLLLIVTCAPVAKIARFLPDSIYIVLWEFLWWYYGIMTLHPGLFLYIFDTLESDIIRTIIVLFTLLVAESIFFNLVHPAPPDVFFMMHDNFCNIYDEIAVLLEICSRLRARYRRGIASTPPPPYPSRQSIDNTINKLDLKKQRDKKDIASTPLPPYSP